MEIIGGFQTSVRKALGEIDPNFEKYRGLVICGRHAPDKKTAEEEILRMEEARLSGIPTLGICWGLQVMMIEYARNVWKIKDATSEELDADSANAIIVKMPQLRVGIKDVGGRMESHWHNYRIQEISALEMDFVVLRSEEIVEQMRLKAHPFYVGTQFHPEYQSSVDHPHPLLVDFLRICNAA